MEQRQGKNYKPYAKGDKVWLEGKHLSTTMPSTKLNPKRYGPFTITDQIGNLAYRLDLPDNMRIHPVFHGSLLSPYTETEEYGPNFERPAPDLIEDEEQYEVEAVVDSRRHRGKDQYLVKWKGYPTSENTWQSADDLANAQEALEEYNKQRGTNQVKQTKRHKRVTRKR